MREAIGVFEGYLRDIPSVEGIKTQRPQHIDIWTVVNNASQEERDAIYHAEWKLLRRFPDMLFNFHLLDRYDGELSTIMTFEEPPLP